MYKLSEITPEQAASLTSNCRDVESMGGGRYGNNDPRYYQAVLWCSKKHDYISAKGNTILEAVVNVHNELEKIGYY